MCEEKFIRNFVIALSIYPVMDVEFELTITTNGKYFHFVIRVDENEAGQCLFMYINTILIIPGQVL
jgi:hypothetical protein